MKLSLRFLLCLSLVLLGRVAGAQEEEDAPPATPPTVQPAPPAAGEASTPSAREEQPDKPPTKEEANRQKRSGFTMEIGLGASFMTSDVKRVEDEKFGLAPLSVGLGAWLSRDVALTFRMTGTSLFQDRAGKTEQVVLGFYGAGVQYYLSDHVFLGGGLGLGLIAGLPVGGGLTIERGADRFVPRAGLAAHFRSGFAFYSDKKNQVSFTTEVVPLWLGDSGIAADAVGFSIGLGWQLM
jgi:hypothetical protein